MAAIWSSRGDADAKACFGFAAPSVQLDLRDKAQQQQVLKNVYNGIGWKFPRLLELMPSAPDFYFDAAAQIRMARWSQGRVALAGDAGYCPSPMSGQGTSLALIGAYVLAGELAAASGVYQTAFQQYEREMRPFVALNQELAVRSAKLMRQKEKRVSTWLLEQIMRIAHGRMIEFFIDRSTRRIQHAANAITLKDVRNRTRCKLPELRRAKIRARARAARYFRLALLEERKHLLLARATDRPVCLNFAIAPST